MPEVEAVLGRVADALCEVGLFGPLNIQGEITTKGFKIFELNPRFTRITGMRTALGFRECGAMIRYLEGETVEKLQDILCIDTTKIVFRFIGDCIVDQKRGEISRGMGTWKRG